MNSLPQPTRRTLLRTAAWSVPAVTVATAAPAFAASNSHQLSLAVAENAQGTDRLQWRTANSFRYLYMTLRLTNLSPTLSHAGTQVRLTFGGAWKDGALTDLDLLNDAEWPTASGWSEIDRSGQSSLNSPTVITFGLNAIGSASSSLLSLRIRRQGLTSNTPYGAVVGATIVSGSVATPFEIDAGSLEAFNAPPS